MISNSSEDFNWYLSISKSRDSHNPSPEFLSNPNTGIANGLTSILLLIVRLLFFWLVIIIQLQQTNSSWTELISFSCFKTQLLSGLRSNKVLWTKGPSHDNATQPRSKSNLPRTWQENSYGFSGLIVEKATAQKFLSTLFTAAFTA